MPFSLSRASLLVALLILAGLLLARPALAEPDGPMRPRLRIPLAGNAWGGCPTTSAPYGYDLVPVPPPPTDRPAAQHADLNLELRSWKAVGAALRLVDYGGPTDTLAPKLNGLFADRRVPGFTAAHQVYGWNWGCGADGCRGALITSPQVTLLGLSTREDELLFLPSSGREIHPGGYTALVLYAEETRLTLKYTRQDNVVDGYTIHLESVCVDPALLRLYRQANANGRGSLPALRNGQPLGTAQGRQVLAAVRDAGSFLDPRSRKDWWQ